MLVQAAGIQSLAEKHQHVSVTGPGPSVLIQTRLSWKGKGKMVMWGRDGSQIPLTDWFHKAV